MPPAQDPQGLTQEQAKMPAAVYLHQKNEWIRQQNVAAKEAEEQAQKEAKDQEARAREVGDLTKAVWDQQEAWFRSWSLPINKTYVV
jgi:hypothetical protein